MADDNKTAAAVAARELTLALLFLNRWREGEGKKNARKYWPWQAWKNFNFDILDELAEKDFVRGSHSKRKRVRPQWWSRSGGVSGNGWAGKKKGQTPVVE